MGVYHNRFGIRGTCLGTGAAANAESVINNGIKHVLFVDERNGFRRADFHAGAAVLMVDVNHTFIFQEINLPYLRHFLVFNGKRQDGACRADPAADVAFIFAKAVRIIHFRLQQSADAVFQQ